MAERKPKHTEILILTGIVAVLLTAGIVLLNEFNSPLNGLIRFGAVLGYLGIFLACLSSLYVRELTQYFGRKFITLHHLVARTSLVALTVHAVGVAWRMGTPAAFLPDVSSPRAFLALGGRPAFWLFAITALTAMLRASVGKAWRPIHWLNYVAFWLGTVHALMIGPNFRHPVTRIAAIGMALTLLGAFVWKRTQKRRAQRKKGR